MAKFRHNRFLSKPDSIKLLILPLILLVIGCNDSFNTYISKYPSASTSVDATSNAENSTSSSANPFTIFDIPGLLHIQGYIGCSVGGFFLEP